ncbi:membrane protein of unknown function [Ruminococcaceae bacterium BL-4]|nr:membrane protein of unknown function [Ruminococcaceae bacterium BL-4]
MFYLALQLLLFTVLEDVGYFFVTPAWGVSSFLETIAHWTVAVFFMISGATLLGYRTRYSTEIFFQKRFFHVVLPFLLWSAIYFITLIFIILFMYLIL